MAAVRKSVTVAGRAAGAVARAFTAGVTALPGLWRYAQAGARAWLGPTPLTGIRAGPAAVMRRGSRGPAA